MIAFLKLDLEALRTAMGSIDFVSPVYQWQGLIEADGIAEVTPSAILARPALYARWTWSYRGGSPDAAPRMPFNPSASSIERHGNLIVRSRTQKGAGAGGHDALTDFTDRLLEGLWSGSTPFLVFRVDQIATNQGSDADSERWGLDIQIPFKSMIGD